MTRVSLALALGFCLLQSPALAVTLDESVLGDFNSSISVRPDSFLGRPASDAADVRASFQRLDPGLNTIIGTLTGDCSPFRGEALCVFGFDTVDYLLLSTGPEEAILGATISATGTGPAGLEIAFRFDNALSIVNIPVGNVGLDGVLASTPLGFREAGIDLVNAGISGHGALIGSTAFADEPGAFSLSYTATVLVGPRAIPLPATAWLMLAGVGGLATMRKLALKMPKPQTGDLR